MAEGGVFGIEPIISVYAMYVAKHDFVVTADGRATPTLELVQEGAVTDINDEDYCLIKLVSQRTLRVQRGQQIQIARKGINTNAS